MGKCILNYGVVLNIYDFVKTISMIKNSPLVPMAYLSAELKTIDPR